VPANEGKGTANLPLKPLFTAKIQKAQKAWRASHPSFAQTRNFLATMIAIATKLGRIHTSF